MRKLNRLSVLIFVSIFVFSSAFIVSQVTKEETKKDEQIKMPEKYKKWMEEEVIYLISQNEREVFETFKKDEDRENFIKTFWRRRDPSPATPFNEFREEHYRRIEYANKQFFEGRTGWRTDRGRVYVMFGPPDFRETNPSGGRGFIFDPSGPTAEFPAERWTYRHIPGLKSRMGQVELIFVEAYGAGAYQLTSTPALANALRNASIPARYVGYEDNPDTTNRSRSNRDRIAQERLEQTPLYTNPLEQLTLLAQLNRSRGEYLEEVERSARMRKLKGIVNARESLTDLPFVAQENFVSGDGDYTDMPISLEVPARNIAFKKQDDRYKGRINFYIEVKDAQGAIYQKSDILEMNLREETYLRRISDYYQFKQRLKLEPGEYALHIVVWDEYSGNVGYADRKIMVPGFPQDKFDLSDIILARDMRLVKIKKEEMVIESKDNPALKALEKAKLKVPEKIKIDKTQTSPFTFDNLQINPNPVGDYVQNSDLYFFYQVYNPTFDAQQKVAKLFVEYQILQNGKVVGTVGTPKENSFPISQKGKSLNSGAKHNLGNILPGRYILLVRVKDVFSGKVIEREIDFKVNQQ